MSADQPRALPKHLRALVDGAATAETPLCDVDEAQLLAVGWIPPGRGGGATFAGGASPHEFPGLPAAEQSLLDHGLAVRGSSDTPAALTVAGALRSYLDLIVGHRLQNATWGSYPQSGSRASARLTRRITPIRDSEVAVVERMSVPAQADPNEPLPVAVSLMPIAAVTDELTELAFRAPASDAERSTAPGIESVFIGPDRKDPAFPSVLVHRWDEERAVLTWRTLSLFGRRHPGEWVGRSRLVLPRVTPLDYREHLLRRLRCPEPPLT